MTVGRWVWADNGRSGGRGGGEGGYGGCGGYGGGGYGPAVAAGGVARVLGRERKG
jgi:hypothetical protein